MNPTLSIIIATRNRIPYCIHVIETILQNEDPDFELIIQDNSDSLELQEYVSFKNDDQRLVYNYTPPPISSIDNFNFALGLAKGFYVCLIGDDDGINPEIFKLIKWAKQNNIDALLPSLNVVYYWPNSGIMFDGSGDDSGLLNISGISATSSLVGSSKEVTKLMKNGGQGYLNLKMPKIYHGIVKKSFMDSIKNITGHFFGGLSPDIYSAVALSLLVNRTVKIDYPLTIAGICKKSTSADSGTGKHSGKLEDAPHLQNREGYVWSDRVPRFYSVETIWADSALASLKDLNRNDILSKFNLRALTFFCLKHNKAYRKIIIKHYLDYNANSALVKSLKWIGLINYFIVNTVLDLTKRSVFKILRKRQAQVTFYGVKNIGEAQNILSEYLSSQNKSIEDVIKELDNKFLIEALK